MERPRPHLVVVGGGITGLATAFRAVGAAREADVPLDVTVLEATDRVGGNIRTEVAEGFTLEWGPNGFLDNVPATLDLVRDVGVASELQPADPRAAVRYVWRKGRLHPLPTGPGSFLASPVLSLRGRLRVLAEPFQPRGPSDADETVRTFGVRRIGAEATDVLIDAMVSGVYAGNVSELSLPSAFPKMRAMEARYGSLVKAMVARRWEGRARSGSGGGGPAGPGGTLTSFRRGVATLPVAVARRLRDRVRVSAPVRGLVPDGAGRPPWTVALEGGEELRADAVLLAVPAPAAAALTRSVDEKLAGMLDAIPSAGLAVVCLGYPEDGVAHAPDGFGFLVPRSQGLRILGCLRDSSVFPGRAPEGRALLRVMIGGAHDPAAVELPEDELVRLARVELATTLGIRTRPVLTRVFRHRLGIAQYVLGHGERLRRIHRRLEDLPGLHVAGSAFHGIAMNACIERSVSDAEALVAELNDVRRKG